MTNNVDKLITNIINILGLLTIFLHTRIQINKARKVYTISYLLISIKLIVINSN